jgi:RNA polymerase sigma-70 factor (ECF subfamily)
MTESDRFETFVREYQDMVFAVAVRLLGMTADAEDIAQTVFLKAFQRFHAIERDPAVAGWLKTVTVNLCLNYLSRYRARWQFFSEIDAARSDDRGEGFAASLAAPAALDSEAKAAQDAQDANLERALRQLPDHQRVPLVLYHFERMSYQEIAAKMGVSLAKVKTDIHRGREALRKELSVADGAA